VHPTGETAVYNYSPAHELIGIKWKGIEQYASTGVASLIGSITNDPNLTNGALLAKLTGVIGNIENCVADAVLGKEVQAQPICNGTDCAKPPVCAGPDGVNICPIPVSEPKLGDFSKLCNAYPDKKTICKICVFLACDRGFGRASCCDSDRTRCVGENMAQYGVSEAQTFCNVRYGQCIGGK
jgi:hypothetical protein